MRSKGDTSDHDPNDEPQELLPWFEEVEQFWTHEAEVARRPWSRLFARLGARWARRGVQYHRRKAPPPASDAGVKGHLSETSVEDVEQFWTHEAEVTRRPWSRLFARLLARWARSGAEYHRRNAPRTASDARGGLGRDHSDDEQSRDSRV